jgi:hypothetical protein
LSPETEDFSWKENAMMNSTARKSQVLDFSEQKRVLAWITACIQRGCGFRQDEGEVGRCALSQTRSSRKRVCRDSF